VLSKPRLQVARYLVFLDDIRELIEGNYCIFYQVFAERLVVLTVFEGHLLFPEEKVVNFA
jgi:hypothetical protein